MMPPLRPRTLACAALVLASLGCDLSVSNPGPVDESALDSPAAHAALVNGMSRSLSRALGFISFTSGAAARELLGTGTGQTNGFGVTFKQENGILDPAPDETDLHWQYAQQARWVAEDGVRRMRHVLGPAFDTSPVGARALVHVGFANRLLGENMCHAVFDGGPVEPRRAYFTRAEEAFSEALAIAGAIGQDSIAHSARAGRAAVRVWLGDWAGATADAGAVPSAFRYVARFSATEQDLYNRIYWASANQPFRQSTVWSTFYESYFTTYADPRTRWVRHTVTMPTGRPWFAPDKYRQRDAPITLASGREMRLIVAEGKLRAGDWPGALAIITALRAEMGVAPWTVSTPDEAWTALKRERGIELWIEGRRLGDLNRWSTDGTPGVVENMSGRDTCFPIGETELNTNPNLAGHQP